MADADIPPHPYIENEPNNADKKNEKPGMAKKFLNGAKQTVKGVSKVNDFLKGDILSGDYKNSKNDGFIKRSIKKNIKKKVVNTIFKSILELYTGKSSFFGLYGFSVLNTIMMILPFMFGTAYNEVKYKSRPIKEDWSNQRCDPSVVPFAGLINPGDKSAIDATQENLQKCGQDVTRSLSVSAMEPYNYLLDMLSSIFKVFIDSINKIRKTFNDISEQVVAFFKQVISFIMNIMVSIQPILIALKDIFGKLKATGATVLFTSYGAYLTLISTVANAVKLAGIFMGVTGSITIVLWVLYAVLMGFFFTIPVGLAIFPVAVSATLIFVISIIFFVFIYLIFRKVNV